MKLLSFVVPSYNSEKYLNKCVDSLLKGGEDVEIIIVNDGSKDNTIKIAREYEEKYPSIIKVVDKENGGHGSGINSGLEVATGLYFKCVDSDDWVDEDALKEVIKTIKEHLKENKLPDLYYTNFVFERVDENTQKRSDIKKNFPLGKFFTWKDIKPLKPSEYILMHMMIYKLDILKKCHLHLLEHTFYVDNLFVYQPLPYVNTLYYLDVDLYRYYIGREDQSVNEQIMISRIDQQLRVNKIMIDCCDVMSLKSRKLRNYMIKYLTMLTTVSTVLCVKSGTEENLAKRDELWQYLEETKPEVYKAVKHTLLGSAMQLRSPAGQKLIVKGYGVSQKIFGFN